MCFFVWFSGGKRRGDQEKMGFLEKVNGFERIKKGKRKIRKSNLSNALKKFREFLITIKVRREKR